MIYGVTFINPVEGTKHTYNDWGLLQVGAAYLSPPEVQTHYIDVSGMDGSLDATEALDGFVHYYRRTFKAMFKCGGKRSSWKSTYANMLKHLHGKQLQAIFDDDERHVVKGRFTVGEPEFSKDFFTIEVTGLVDPYRYVRRTSLADWLWDPFVFEDDIAWDYKDIEIVGSLFVPVIATEMPVIPTFYCTAPMALDVLPEGGGTADIQSFNLPRGESVVPNLILKGRTYSFRFYGNGKVDIFFEGGEL